MYATIQKWGNSLGLRIPKPLLDALGIHENDRVELLSDHDSITIRKVSAPAHKTLEERLTAYYGKRLLSYRHASAGYVCAKDGAYDRRVE